MEGVQRTATITNHIAVSFILLFLSIYLQTLRDTNSIPKTCWHSHKSSLLHQLVKVHALVSSVKTASMCEKEQLTRGALKGSWLGSGRVRISEAEKEFRCLYHRQTDGCVSTDGGLEIRPTTLGSAWLGMWPWTQLYSSKCLSSTSKLGGICTGSLSSSPFCLAA